MLWPQTTADRAIWRSGCSQGGMHSSIWYMGSKVTTWVAPSPCAASHASFSSSVQIFSVIGIHGWTVAMCSHLPLSAISVSSGEALRTPVLSREAEDHGPCPSLRVYGAWAPMDVARTLQPRCSHWPGRRPISAPHRPVTAQPEADHPAAG